MSKEKKKAELKIFTISDKLYRRVIELWLGAGRPKDFIHPIYLKHSPEFAIIERLILIINLLFDGKEDFVKNKAFAELYTCCLSGKNPFKKEHVDAAGVNWDDWTYLLKSAWNGFEEYKKFRTSITQEIIRGALTDDKVIAEVKREMELRGEIPPEDWG